MAQTWPARTITAIVPFAAGSGADVVARIAMEEVSRQLGQAIVIENRGGAGGTLGSNIVAKAAPDGYTILATGALATADAIYPKKPYDTLRDFTPVIPLGQQPLVLVTAPSKNLNSVGELIAAAKARPGALNFASAGIGSASHFAAERFRAGAGFDAQHIPFRGAAEALTDVLAGRSEFFFLPLAPALPLVTEGRLVALTVSTASRASALPQVPSIAELGFAKAAYDFWVGLFLPAKAPRDVVDRWHRATEAALQMPAVQARLAAVGVEPMPMTPDGFSAFFRAEVEMHIQLVKLANIVAQQ